MNEHVRRTFNDAPYLLEFREYLNRHCCKWLNVGLSAGTAEIFSRIAVVEQENSRCEYLRYFLWIFDRQYYIDNELDDYVRTTLHILQRIYYDYRYNDFNMHRFIEVVYTTHRQLPFRFEDPYFASQAFGGVPVPPYEDVFEELMKFIFTFIVAFKRNHDLPIAYDARVNEY